MPIDFPTDVKGLAFFPIEFDKQGAKVDDAQTDALETAIKSDSITDILVLAHGWNNDEAQAMALYRNLLSSVAAEADSDFDARAVAVVGVFWPSRKFAEADLIAGGAAAVGDDDLSEDALKAQLEAMRGLSDEDDEETFDRMIELVPDLEDRRSAQVEFVELLRSVLGPDAAAEDELADEIPSAMLTMDGADMLDELGTPRDEEFDAGSAGGIAAVGGVGDAVGGAAGIGSFLKGIRAGARNALNMVTYYKMKARAGLVGRSGLAPLLRDVKSYAPSVRVHLIGHSFGGRLVAATALGVDDAAAVLPIDSMTLLQAAFSHNGFAQDWDGARDGYFRDVYAERRVSGPTLVTYTPNDKANRVAYPLASRLRRQVAAALGDADDEFGAIGANGAQSTPEAVAGNLLSSDGTYAFKAGVVYNLESSDYVANHGDVANREIANAIVAAVNAT